MRATIRTLPTRLRSGCPHVAPTALPSIGSEYCLPRLIPSPARENRRERNRETEGQYPISQPHTFGRECGSPSVRALKFHVISLPPDSKIHERCGLSRLAFLNVVCYRFKSKTGTSGPSSDLCQHPPPVQSGLCTDIWKTMCGSLAAAKHKAILIYTRSP